MKTKEIRLKAIEITNSKNERERTVFEVETFETTETGTQDVSGEHFEIADLQTALQAFLNRLS